MLMVGGVLTGGLPVSIAADGQRRIKLAVKDMSATGYGAFPQFFQTKDGRKHPVVTVGLSGVRATGLCGSGKAQTPLGDYVVRVETKGGQQLRADDLKIAIENVDGGNLAGGTITLNRHDTAPDGTPIDSGHEGALPITARSMLLDLHADVRWVTVSGLKLSAVDLSNGTDVKECF
ncbi:DUF6230 family protein [Saccharopolyspora sp. NPDC049426]|uniref:DUF6230 family protein n=1 Tax=Saccharopolyspora sp. NPDC049426 TaxID=3155652 RepID=UPI0034444818